MRKILACVGAVMGLGSAVQACSIVTFDYSSFSRPPAKPDLQRYLAGDETVDYLSVGLNGITLQISPANWTEATTFRAAWEAWTTTNTHHDMLVHYQNYFEPPVRVATPFEPAGGESLVGYLSPIMKKYRPKANPMFENTILFAFVEDAKESGAASLYLNDPTGQGDMAAVMAQYAALMVIDPTCSSDTGAYEGRYLPEQAQYVVFPVEAFSDND